MAKALVVSIPHRLAPAEARRRLRQGLAWFKTAHGATFPITGEVWAADHVAFRLGALGFSTPGRITVTAAEATLAIDLPWVVWLLAKPLQGVLTKKARVLLGSVDTLERPDRHATRAVPTPVD